MSDLDKLKNAGKVDPAVAAVSELGEALATTMAGMKVHVDSSSKEIKDQVGRLEQKGDERHAQVEAGFDHQRERLDLIERRVTSMRISGPSEPHAKLLAAMPEAMKSLVSLCERAPSGSDKGAFNQPEFKGTTAAWALLSMMAQNRNAEMALAPRYGIKNAREEFEKYDRAWPDAYGYTKATGIFGTAPDGLGGSLMPDPVEAEMNRLVKDNSIMRNVGIRTIPMQTKSVTLPVRGTDALTVQIGTEGSDIGESVADPGTNTIGELKLTAARFEGYAVASIEVLQDSPLSVVSWLQAELTEGIAALEDVQALEGTGAGVNFTGVVAASGVNSIAAGTNGDAITYAKLSAVPYKARSRASRRLARWFLAPEAMTKIVGLRADAVTAADGAGQPIFMYGNVPNGIPPTILGFASESHDGISIARTKGSGTALTNIYFGPPNTIVFGDRAGMSWDTSEAPGFKKYQLAMRLIKRTAIGVALPKAWVKVLDLITA